MSRLRALRPAAALALAATMLAACGGTAPAGSGGTGGTADVTVFAAASLTEVVEELAGTYEELHPGAQVRLNVAGSQQLATQLLQGAPADLFAAADARQMQRVTDAGLAGAPPVVFATNHLAIVVEPGNPLGITGLADLADPDVTVVVGTPQVPVGHYARQALERAGVRLDVASEELDVRSVLAKVRLGEADAGIVYASDASTMPGVESVAVAATHDVEARYPAAIMSDAPHPDGAQAFLGLLTGDRGRQVLTAHGFGTP